MHAFVARLREEGERRYHDRHPFHVRMHAGALDRRQLRAWVANRYYYQTRVPIKDALVLAKMEDRAWRRVWIRRLHDQDGDGEREGGLAQWLMLARGVGLEIDEVARFTHVVPAARAAADAYVEFVRGASLLEAVASSLTECFSPDLLHRRVAAWERHYPWVDRDALAYFRDRPPRATRDAGDALAIVTQGATTPLLQDACVAALVRKCDLLNALLDAIDDAVPDDPRERRPKLSAWARLRWDERAGRTILIGPERGLLLDERATAIVEMCDGAHTIDRMVACLADRFAAKHETRVIDRDVRELVDRLGRARLVE
jgi:pyrroloquinoline-quinone synthase